MSSAVSYTVSSSVASLTIQGQTNVNCTGTAGQSNYACSATDGTTIQDADANYDEPDLTITTQSPATLVRLTGITFAGGTTNAAKDNGVVQFDGSFQNLRVVVGHNLFEQPQLLVERRRTSRRRSCRDVRCSSHE